MLQSKSSSLTNIIDDNRSCRGMLWGSPCSYTVTAHCGDYYCRYWCERHVARWNMSWYYSGKGSSQSLISHMRRVADKNWRASRNMNCQLQIQREGYRNNGKSQRLDGRSSGYIGYQKHIQTWSCTFWYAEEGKRLNVQMEGPDDGKGLQVDRVLAEWTDWAAFIENATAYANCSSSQCKEHGCIYRGRVLMVATSMNGAAF